MREEDPDRELARLFREVRRADEAAAPGFGQVLARRRTESGASGRPRLFASAAVALIAIVVLIGGLLLRRPPATEPPERPIALGDWRAATDVLLRTPGSELLDSMPALPAPVPDYSSIAGTLHPRIPEPTARRSKGA
jgi:hypothetical protein